MCLSKPSELLTLALHHNCSARCDEYCLLPQKLLSRGLLKPLEVLQVIAELARQFPGWSDPDTIAAALNLLSEDPDLPPAYPDSFHDEDYVPIDLADKLRACIALARRRQHLRIASDEAYHLVGHVRLTPTGMDLTGPLPDISNRVLRRYPQAHHYFIRVTFCEEDALEHFGSNKEHDVREFVAERFGKT